MTRPSTQPLQVLVTLDFPASFLDRIRQADPRIVLHHHPVSEDVDLATAVPDHLLRSAEVMYTSAVLPGPGKAPCLRWAQLDTSGIDHVRNSALWDSSIVMTTLGGISPAPLAEWILMMVLTHAHHLRETERLAAERTWPSRDYRWKALMPHNLRTSTMSIIGYGRIGKEVARLSRAFGMDVIAVRRGTPSGVEGRFGDLADVPGVNELPLTALHEVLSRSDYVVLTVPLTPQTQNLIGRDQLATMKPEAVLINASRGGVVDETALLAAVNDGHLDLVASDVFAQEPLGPQHPFWDHPRVLVTPHVAGFAPDYLEVVGTLFSTNLQRYLSGEALLNVADRERGY